MMYSKASYLLKFFTLNKDISESTKFKNLCREEDPNGAELEYSFIILCYVLQYIKNVTGNEENRTLIQISTELYIKDEVM